MDSDRQPVMPKIKSNNHQILERNGKHFICLTMVILVLAIFWPLSHYKFINYDDDLYVTENRYVRSGLTRESLAWAFNFEEKRGNYWQPLTWLSHMLDVQLYGLDAGRHHLSNVFFHIASAILLFLAFFRMTGARWRSAFVAVLFALHPLNVESVAWVAERKNVLSTFFWMLTLLMYDFYQKRPGKVRYTAVLFVFSVGLLAKPMLVTLPFVLLLLDFWPHRRIKFEGSLRNWFTSAGPIILEKIPLLFLSALSVYLSTASVKGLGNSIDLQSVPLLLRVENALVSYPKYLFKCFWPTNLSLYYPFPQSIPLWQSLGTLVLLAVISVGVLRFLKKHPYLAVGWLWYLGTLIPVIGLVQVGMWPAMADRWAYIPFIGLFIMMAWGSFELIGANRQQRILGTIAAAVIIATLMSVSRIQVGYWENSITIFEHTIKSTGGSWMAHNNLATALGERGKINEAIHHYHLALEKDPPEPEGIYYNMAAAFSSQGRDQRAIEHYLKALEINPDYAAAHINIGVVLSRQGRADDAVRHFLEGLRIEPNSEEAHYNLGNVRLAQNKVEQALRHYSKAVRINPFFAEPYNGLGLVLMQKGKLNEAILHFRKAANIKPAYMDAQKNQKLAESIYDKIRSAVAQMQDSMNFNPQDHDIDLRMEELLEKKKKLDQAIFQFARALSLQPGFASLDENRISMVTEIRQKYEAKLAQFYEIIERRPNTSAADYHIACIYSRRGQIDDAIKWLNQAIQKGFNRWDVIKTDSDLNGIRDSKNFQMLVKG